MIKKARIGDILVSAGIISDVQLRAGLAYQNQWGVQLGEAFVVLGFITEVDLLKALAKQLQVPAVNLAKTFISPETLKLIKPDLATRNCIIPLAKRIEKGQETLLVATADPTNLMVQDEITFLINMPIKFVIATRTSIKKAIRKFYYNERVDFAADVDDRIKKLSEVKDEDLVVLKNEKSSPQLAEEIPELSIPVDYSPKPVRASSTPVSREFQALLRILIKKGLITRSEYIDELQKL